MFKELIEDYNEIEIEDVYNNNNLLDNDDILLIETGFMMEYNEDKNEV